MKKLIFSGLVIAASAIIIMSFFMPWAKVQASVTKASKELTGYADKELGDSPFAGKFIKKLDEVTGAISTMGDVEIKSIVRGYKIPALVNSDSSKVALSLAQVLFKSAKGIDKKSYLVYLLPIFAVICAFLVIIGLKNKLYILLMTIIGGAISIGGLYNLLTMDLSSTIVKISIERGLWYTMYAFLLIFLVGIAWLVLDRKKA